VLKGAYNLYGATSYLSDVLSYSRLLALGLATGVISQVVNQMAVMVSGGVIGKVFMLLVLLIGHAFNIGISLIGCYVHTCRLQYIEFFGKFYEGGGREFKPFAANTKHFKFKEEN
ncbi:MAG: V-type ATP synthase subunit I, partial [Clostridia bacterium]|nr:V-type ATP synthase subunit I [Clostridia bacterium]